MNFYTFDITGREISETINTLLENEVTGPDELSHLLLKHVSHSFAEPIQYFKNKYLSLFQVVWETLSANTFRTHIVFFMEQDL